MRPKEVIIHIGVQKTATSFLQQSFFPKLTNHVLISRPYTQLNHAWNKLQYGNDKVYNVEEIRRELATINAERIILSDESFEGNAFGLTNCNRDVIAGRLKELFPLAEIVIVIRDHYDWLFSLYRQYLKAHRMGVKLLNDVIHFPAETFEWNDLKGNRNQFFFNTSEFVIHPVACKYSDLIATYKSHFNSVRVYLYEDFVEQSVFLFRDLFMDYPDQIFNEINNDYVNERLSDGKLKRYMHAKRFYVLTNSARPSLLSKGYSSLAALFDNSDLYELDEEKRKRIDQIFYDDCRILMEEHGLNMRRIPSKYLNRF